MGQNRVTTGTEDENTPIETLALGIRTYNCLKRSNIVTVRQILSLQKQQLLHIRNLTPQNYEEIRERLIACRFLHPTRLTGPFSEEEGNEGS